MPQTPLTEHVQLPASLQGDTWDLTVSLEAENEDGTTSAVDLAAESVSVTLTLREPRESGTVLELSNAPGEHANASGGTTTFSVPPAETQKLRGTYRFAIQYEYGDGTTRTYVTGTKEFRSE